MERFLFFNANEIAPGVYDREYVESDFADYFGSVLSTGLLHTDNAPGAKAAVAAGTLNTIVSPGKAIMKGHLYENTAPLTLTHSIPEATLDRIDRIVLRLDLRNQSRFIKLFVSEGIPASTPVAPVLQRDQFIHEISLAQVRVRKNTVQLLPSDLVDERLNEQLCGLAHSLISIPTDQLQAFITAKRTELNVEMNTALDSYLASLAAAESKLASDLVRWEQQWSDWFATIQGSAFVTGAEFASHKADYLKHTGYAVATGNANVYIATLDPALSAYQEGVSLRLKINVANTGASTVNVNGLGAKAIKKSNGNAVASGNLKAGSVYTLAYDGTSFILQGEGGSGNLKPSQALKGFTFTNDDGEQIGEGDENLLPNNIKKSISIFGVTGNYSGFNAGDVYFHLNSSERDEMDRKSYYTMKESTILLDGHYRISFALRNYLSSATDPVYGQVFINDVAVGIERSSKNDIYVTYTQDFELKANDKVQIKGRTLGNYQRVLIKDLRIGNNINATINR